MAIGYDTRLQGATLFLAAFAAFNWFLHGLVLALKGPKAGGDLGLLTGFGALNGKKIATYILAVVYILLGLAGGLVLFETIRHIGVHQLYRGFADGKDKLKSDVKGSDKKAPKFTLMRAYKNYVVPAPLAFMSKKGLDAVMVEVNKMDPSDLDEKS